MQRPILDITQEVYVLSAIITKHARQNIEQRLADQGVRIGPMQFGMLRLLRHGPQTISELSQTMLLSPATLVPAVDALEQAGLVERTKDPRDRRRTPLMLTESGTALLLQVPPVTVQDALTQALVLLDEDQHQQLLTLLRTVVGHFPNGARIIEHVATHIQQPDGRDAASNRQEVK
ncbi:MAG: MarR family transcriptional regulator [Chloroflexota bacterium]